MERLVPPWLRKAASLVPASPALGPAAPLPLGHQLQLQLLQLLSQLLLALATNLPPQHQVTHLVKRLFNATPLQEHHKAPSMAGSGLHAADIARYEGIRAQDLSSLNGPTAVMTKQHVTQC